MELLQLKYFLLLAKNPHVSNLATQLHVSQPALTATIKRLERELGVSLFQREGRQIRLSEYGELYQSYVEEMFYALEGGAKAIDRLKMAQKYRLSLSLTSSNTWRPMLEQFSGKYPEIMIDQLYSEDASKVLSGQADFYVGAVTEWEKSQLDTKILYEDDMVLLVNRDHPLAGCGSISLSDCKNETYINLGRHTSLQAFINTMFLEAGFKPRVVLECDYTLREEMVKKGYGISVTTKRSVENLDPDIFDYLYITFPIKKRVLSIATKRQKIFTQSMQTFLDYALQYYK